MHPSAERALDRLLLLATLFIGIAIGLLISPPNTRRVDAHVQEAASPATQSGAQSGSPTVIPITNYMAGPAIVGNIVLAHEFEADHAVVNGYDLLLLDQNIINYLAKLPLANGPELTSIGERSKSTTHYIIAPAQKPPVTSPGGTDGKQTPK